MTSTPDQDPAGAGDGYAGGSPARFAVGPPATGRAGTVVVTGDVDLANADQLHAALTEAAGDGTGLTVDLTEVTYLDSAAVRTLFAVVPRADVTLIVPRNGPIGTLLSVSGLDQVTTVTTRD